MCLPDTAEYWQDVKRKTIYTGREFYHIPNENINCGNKKHHTTPYIGDINCFACKEIIKNGYKEDLIEGKAPETYYMSNNEKKKYNAIKRFEKLYGKCSCGSSWTLRNNSVTNIQFLGCSNYPKCKNTKNITK